MQRPVASVPRANPIGSTHSLAELGAISSANTQNTGSSTIYTRPTASVPKPTPIQSPANNPPVAVFPSVPKANPAGVGTTVQGVNISTPLGRPNASVPKPNNYSHGPEE
jgi:hypothetical protein